MEDLHGTLYIRADRCLSKLHECLSMGILGGFDFSEGNFHDMNISFDETIGFRKGWASSGKSEAILVCEGVPFSGVKGLPAVSENFYKVPLRVNSF